MNRSQQRRQQTRNRQLRQLTERRENFLKRLREIDDAIANLNQEQRKAAA